jgi:hypothetical protein
MTRLALLFLLAGSTHATFSDIYPSALQSGSTGFKILGGAGNVLGDRASTAGDFNGDGLADILFACGGSRKIFVVFGRRGSSPFSTINIVDFVAGDSTGFSVYNIEPPGGGWLAASAIGDVNGDGIDDVVVGNAAVDYAGRTDTGAAYILYGRRTGIADISASSWATSTSNGFRLYGERTSDGFGTQVVGIGDFNGDGTQDFFAYAVNGDLPSNGDNNFGVIYVIFGKGTSWGTDIDMLTGFTYGTQGFRIYPFTGLTAVPGACGDVNNDGYADVAVSAGTGTFSGRANNGGVYIIFGHSTATTFADVYLSAFTSGTAGFLIIGAVAGDNLGLPAQSERAHIPAVGRGGDFNGDGLYDLAIGALGKAYILFGRSGITTYSTIDLASWPDSVNKGQRFVAQTPSAYTIRNVGSLGDFNGDGVGDIFIFNGQQNGATGWGAVIFGHKNTTAYNDITFETFTTSTGFRLLSSEGNSYFGIHAGRGDVNGDSAPDLIIAATLAYNGGNSAGTVYVLYGQVANPTSQPSSQPSRQPTSRPSVQPASIPSSQPSRRPTAQPSCQPVGAPTAQPSSQPSTQPSVSALQSILASPTYKVKNGFAFSAIGAGGKVSAWGEAQYGGDAFAVQSQLQSGVVSITPSRFAFAAVTAGGSLAIWGVNTSFAGLARYRSLSYSVTSLVATEAAFVGVDGLTGRVIAVGSKHNGGDVLDDAFCNGYSAQLSAGVRSITASAGAFAAIKTDGTLLCWGSKHSGADVASGILSALIGAKMVVATMAAFAVLLSDNTVASWGDRWTGGDSFAVAGQLREVHHLTASRSCFVAFKKSSGVVVWGYGKYGGDTSAVAAALSSHVTQVAHTYTAMAALKADGTVVAWGAHDAGGDASAVQASLHDVVSLVGNGKAFVALTTTGSVRAWGSANQGGTIPMDKVTALFSGVVSIARTERAFTALKNDGSVVVWGQAGHGGEPGIAVEALLTSGVHTICANDVAFSAIKTDGSVVAWGHSVSVPVAGVQFTSSSLAAGAQCA